VDGDGLGVSVTTEVEGPALFCCRVLEPEIPTGRVTLSRLIWEYGDSLRLTGS
jgi:hypothetical protein